MMLTKINVLLVSYLVAASLRSTNVCAFSPSNNVARRGHMNQRFNRPSFTSKEISKRLIFEKLKTIPTKLAASIVEESLKNELPQEKIIHPGIMTSIMFSPVFAAWAFTSKNINKELILGISLFFNLLSMKFIDGIVDDGLRLFRGARYILPMFNIASGIGLFLLEDYIATWFAGLTVACFLTGKLDCLVFQLSGFIVTGLYCLRYFSGNFAFSLFDTLAIAIATGLDEVLHGLSKNLKKTKTRHNQAVKFFLESRLFSVITLVPYFLLRGHHIVAPLMIFQGAGYEIGGFIVENMKKKT